MKKITLLSALFMTVVSFGQEIALYSGEITSLTATVANVSATGLSRGAGIDVNAGASFNSKGYDQANVAGAITANDYIEWAITADADFTVTVTEFQIDYDRSNSGPAALSIRTNLDNYATDIFTDTAVSASGSQNSVVTGLNLKSAVGGAIVFRLYGYSASSTTGTFDIEDDLTPSELSLTNTGIILKGSVNTSVLGVQNVDATKLKVTSANGVVSANTGKIVAVYNTLGQKVANENLKGIYIVKVVMENQVKTVKVFVN